MPNTKITAMPSLAGNQVPTDLVTAVDLSAAPVNQNVKSTLNDLFSVITKNITDRAIRFQAPGSAPAVSAASQGALYHNGTTFQASSNGGAFEQVFTLSAQTAALVFAGPATGGPAVPTFRALALTDLPAGVGTVTSVGLSAPSFLSVANSPVTGSGTLALSLATQAAALVFAGPISGGAAAPAFRLLELTDLPYIATNRLLGRVSSGTGEVESITPGAGVLTWLQTPSSANLLAAVTDETGGGLANDGLLVFNQNPTIVTPIIANIRSGSNQTALRLTGSGANHFVEIVNANQPTGPTIQPAGTATNIPLLIKGKGAGAVEITASAVQAVGVTSGGNTDPGILEARGGNQQFGGGKLYLYERSTNGSNFVGFEAPDSVPSDLFWTLPATDGTPGQALVTDGGAGLSWASFNDAGFKNFLINGDFQIAQRSTSVSAIITSGYYTADRWRSEVVIAPGPNGQFTQTVASGAGDYPDNSGFRNSLKMECSQSFSTPLGATAECRIEQRIEGLNCLPINFGQSGAQQLTLSFWVKSSNTGTFIAELIQPAGSVQVSAAYTINATNTWEQKSVTFPARTSGTLIVNDNSYQLAAGFWLVAGSNYTGGSSLQTTWGNTANRRARGQTNLTTSGNYLQITGVQLEIGTVATDFENLPIDIEFSRCLRYCYVLRRSSADSEYYFGGHDLNACPAIINFPVQMRSRPTSITVQNVGDWRVYQQNAGTAATPTSITLSSSNLFTSILSFNGIAIGGIVRGSVIFALQNTTSAVVIFNGAEL